MRARRERLASASLLAVVSALLGAPPRAVAGGLELPEIGTEALARGGAFTAKADDGSAIALNVAGLAAQRGTRAIADLHLIDHHFTFARSGSYPDDPRDAATPWGGRRYPEVTDRGGLGPNLLATVSSDFGLDGVTFAAGVFTPSAVSTTTYPRAVVLADGTVAPSPARYDTVQPRTTILLPTVAGAARIFDGLDVGAAVHLVRTQFDTSTTSFSATSSASCPRPEYAPCDAKTNVSADAWSLAASVGAIARPVKPLAIGLQVRSPARIEGAGTLTATTGAATGGAELGPSPARVETSLPWIVRAGIRWSDLERDGVERFDLELDGTYEAWSTAQDPGPSVYAPVLGPLVDIHPTVRHRYRDTVSLRAGGTLHLPTPSRSPRFALSAGGFYDGSATRDEDTRVDVDTLAKLGATAGVSVQIGHFTIAAAYARVLDVACEVAAGEVRPINGARHGDPVDGDGKALPAVNAGSYSGGAQILGLSLAWASLVE